MGKLIDALWGRKPKGSAPARDIASLVQGLGQDAIQLWKRDRPSKSYLGGEPKLPDGVEWPHRNGEPLAFLARISLADLQSKMQVEWLPSTGALLFFYDSKQQPWGFDPKDRGGWAVLLAPDIEPMDKRQFRRHENLLPHRPVELTHISVLPSSERPEVAALELSQAEFDLYQTELQNRYGGLPMHQVLGVPSPVQGDSMERECQLASNGVYCGDEKGYSTALARSLEPGAVGWKLLLQLDSDDDLGVMWGDAGVLYFWVEEAAARQGRFDNAWLVLQCA
jgi:uncharacterized protein YwqG